jgi:hypothetical membrane protein
MAAMLGVAWFAAALLALHYGSDGLDWTRHYVSQFANGPHDWLLAVGVVGHAAGNVALGFGLYRSLGRGTLRDWASALFLTATVGFALTGLFAVEAPGAAPSAAGVIHRTASSAAFALELAALVLFSAAFAAQAAWRGMARVSLALSALAAAASATLIVAILIGWRQGLAERAALAPFMAWEFYAGWQLAFRRSK